MNRPSETAEKVKVIGVTPNLGDLLCESEHFGKIFINPCMVYNPPMKMTMEERRSLVGREFWMDEYFPHYGIYLCNVFTEIT